MQHWMRRSDRAVFPDKAREILEKGEDGVLSLLGEEKEPYGIPLSYVVMENTVYFHCAREGRKIQCMKENPSVSFCVVGRVRPKHRPGYFTTLFESVLVTGTVCEAVDPDEKTRALVALCVKYFPEQMPQVAEEAARSARRSLEKNGVYRISIDRITGKANLPKDQA